MSKILTPNTKREFIGDANLTPAVDKKDDSMNIFSYSRAKRNKISSKKDARAFSKEQQRKVCREPRPEASKKQNFERHL